MQDIVIISYALYIYIYIFKYINFMLYFTQEYVNSSSMHPYIIVTNASTNWLNVKLSVLHNRLNYDNIFLSIVILSSNMFHVHCQLTNIEAQLRLRNRKLIERWRMHLYPF